jgi:hypothetical protein
MTANPGLERRYRRLIGLYPPAYRREYTDEVLGVLMESAPEGRHRPSLADTVDMVRGAAAVRLRSVLHGGAGSDWQDALALFTVTAPLLAIAAMVPRPLGVQVFGEIYRIRLCTPACGPGMDLVQVLAKLLALAGFAFLPAILASLRLRRVAAVAALALLAVSVVGVFSSSGGLSPAVIWQAEGPKIAMYQVYLALNAFALLRSPGPRRGLRLITWRGAMIALWWLVTAALLFLVFRRVLDVTRGVTLTLVIIGGLGVVGSLASGRVRRHVALLAIPASALTVSLGGSLTYSLLVPNMAVITIALWVYLVPAIVASLVYGTSRLTGGRAPAAAA